MNEIIDDRILACPSCKLQTNVALKYTDDWRVQVVCKSCDTRGPLRSRIRRAVELWNRIGRLEVAGDTGACIEIENGRVEELAEINANQRQIIHSLIKNLRTYGYLVSRWGVMPASQIARAVAEQWTDVTMPMLDRLRDKGPDAADGLPVGYRACECGCLVSGPASHPCDRCGSLMGDHIAVAWAKNIERIAELEVAVELCKAELDAVSVGSMFSVADPAAEPSTEAASR